jgi:hypothetical protein
MSKHEVSYATIKKVKLYRTRGIPTFTVFVQGDSWMQCFGGYDLRWWGVYPLFRIMDVVGVDEWGDLKGERVRVEYSHMKVHRIGHIVEDRWFCPDQEKDKVQDE